MSTAWTMWDDASTNLTTAWDAYSPPPPSPLMNLPMLVWLLVGYVAGNHTLYLVTRGEGMGTILLEAKLRTLFLLHRAADVCVHLLHAYLNPWRMDHVLMAAYHLLKYNALIPRVTAEQHAFLNDLDCCCHAASGLLLMWPCSFIAALLTDVLLQKGLKWYGSMWKPVGSPHEVTAGTGSSCMHSS